MMHIIAWLFFALAFLLRIPLILFGCVWNVFGVMGYGYKSTGWMFPFFMRSEQTPAPYSETRRGVWWYWSIRNPTPGYHLKQPIKEPRPNPDDIVRSGQSDQHSRYIRHGLFVEYWFLSRTESDPDEFFEFRIGWKFTTGGHIKFGPTIQLREGP